MRSRTIRQLIWLLALLAQLWQTDHYFTYSGPDRNLQMLAAKSHLESGQNCIPQLSAEGYNCKALSGWPPAFSVLIRGFYQLTHDWFLAARWFNGIGVLLVFVAMHFLLLQLDQWLSPWVYPLLFTFWGISFTPFYYTFGIEEWALASFLLASIASVALWQATQWHWGWWFLLAFSIALGFSMRYAYAPTGVLLLMPIVMGRFKEKPWRYQAALSALGLMAVGLGSFWVLSPTTSDGASWYELIQTQHLYLDNLLHFDAFPLKAWAFFSLEGLINKGALAASGFLWFAKALLCLLSIGLLALLWRLFRSSPKRTAFAYIQTSWWAVIFGMVFFLTVLSVVVPPEWHDDQWIWTWVKETRYFAPLLVVIQLLSLQYATERSPQESAITQGITKSFLILAFLYAATHNVYRLWDKEQRGTRWTLEEQKIMQTYEEVVGLCKAGKSVYWREGKLIAEQDIASIAGLAGAIIIPFAGAEVALPAENDQLIILPKEDAFD
ncbi:MAG: hypothetical protein AAF927_01020 [Bacteroidota bacterium]